MADFPYYELNGQRYPRVTRILSILREPEVEKWQQRIGSEEAEEVSREAKKLGTWLHRYIEGALKGQTTPLGQESPDRLHLIGAYHQWKRERGSDLMPQAIEQTYHSATYGYAGTVDLVEAARLTDWKVTGAIRPKHWIQLSAYVPLVFEPPYQVTLRIVRFDKSLGIYEQQERLFHQDDLVAFQHLHEVYRRWFALELQPKEVA